MTSYLYVLSIGPVQGFIAAARRTKDLWFGSYLLSIISKAAAREISHCGGRLIFPGLNNGDPRLDCLENEFSVANVISAELPEGIDDSPETINEKAQAAAKREWIAISEKARNEAGRLVRQDETGQRIWDDQVKDALEFYAAWVPESGNYKKDRAKLMRLLAGRKSIRNFEQANGYFGIPKSSLDGARESVIQTEKPLPKYLVRSGQVTDVTESTLQTEKPLPKWLYAKMGVNDGEQLCAIGLTKRLGRRPDWKRASFPSVVRVAADPWIRGIRKCPGSEANRLLDEIERNCADKNNSYSTGTGDRLYKDFPFDAQVLYPSRLARAKDNIMKILEDSDDENPFREDADKLIKIEKAVNKLEKKDHGCLGLGEPNNYLAVLRADGDRMGNALSAIDSLPGHREFSERLGEFASEAKRIVEDDHHGCMVFSGGDDVLAFLPLDHCLGAASALHNRFGELTNGFYDEQGRPLTLSVGIAIGHYLEPLENLLGFAKDAEKDAKKGKTADEEKDGLAVNIHPRSGAPIKIRQKWRPKGGNGLDERLRKWAEMHCKGEIPDSAAYEMHELAEDYSNWKRSAKDVDKLSDLIISDVLRLLKRKSAGMSTDLISKEDLQSMLTSTEPYEAISRMASELILARRIAQAMNQASGRKNPKEVSSASEAI